MNNPSVTDFVRALRSPGEMFATLGECEVGYRGNRPAVTVTSLFAEARIRLGGEWCLLGLPLRPESIGRAYAAVEVLRQCDGPPFAKYGVLVDELRFVNEWGRECRCSLLLQGVPEGETLDVAVTSVPASLLLEALRELCDEYVRCGVRHCNLKPSNIIYGSDGRLHTIRCHYIAAESSRAAIEAEFAAVGDYVRCHGSDFDHGEAARERRLAAEFEELQPSRDMMRVVRRNGLYGYADTEGRMVIEPRFAYAEPFCENRAVVALGDGRHGVIDRTGRSIIPLEYDMVCWTDNDRFRVAREGLTGEFDYLGREVAALCENLEFIDNW